MQLKLPDHPQMRPWILDGPMGTEINRRNGDTTLPLWSARILIANPEMVKQIHIDYLDAGADIITTNTFRTQYRTLNRAGIGDKAEELTKLAVKLSTEARNRINKNALIAGSIAPLEDCYSPHLVPDYEVAIREHKLMASWLASTEIDLFLIETMNSIKEAVAAVNITFQYDLPIWLSMTCNNEGNILSGDKWEALIQKIRDKIDVLMVNCTSLIGTTNALKKLSMLDINRIGLYPNFGEIDTNTGWKSGLFPDNFQTYVESWLKFQPFVIGTCCGARPKDTLKLRKIIEYSLTLP